MLSCPQPLVLENEGIPSSPHNSVDIFTTRRDAPAAIDKRSICVLPSPPPYPTVSSFCFLIWLIFVDIVSAGYLQGVKSLQLEFFINYLSLRPSPSPSFAPSSITCKLAKCLVPPRTVFTLDWITFSPLIVRRIWRIMLETRLPSHTRLIDGDIVLSRASYTIITRPNGNVINDNLFKGTVSFDKINFDPFLWTRIGVSSYDTLCIENI